MRLVVVASWPKQRIVASNCQTSITAARLALFRTVKEMPGSITQISERMHRDRGAMKRDVDELERAGLVTISDKVLPGHGATANRFSLQAEVV